MPLGIDNQIPIVDMGMSMWPFSEHGSGARSPRSSGLEPIPGHSSYRVMVLYAFVGPRGPGVSIAARRAPLGEAWVVCHRLGEPSLVTSCPGGDRVDDGAGLQADGQEWNCFPRCNVTKGGK